MHTIYIYKKTTAIDWGLFVARDWSQQQITWEIHDKYFLQETPFQFDVKIDPAIWCNFLIRKYCFIECKIIDIQIQKGKKLTKDDKLV